MNQYDEHIRDSAPCTSRFDGFDCGDLGRPEMFDLIDDEDMYMNPSTGSVDTLDGWYPYTEADGLVLVTLDADGSWVAA